MSNLFKRLWWHLTQPAGWRTVRRTVHHATLGTLHYEGTRTHPGGAVNGVWRVNPRSGPSAGGRPITVGFPTMGGEPTDAYLDQLAAILADPDALFERVRPAIAAEYPRWTEAPLPADWRSVLHLEGIDLPPAPEDVDEEGPVWQVTYWCEPAAHWFVVDLEGDKITYLDVAG